MAGLIGPVTVANLTAAAGVVTTIDGWWPALNLTWRTPVPASITRIVAQVRELGSTSVSETVLTPNAGAASVVNGVAVGQHLQVRLSPAGAPGLPFQPTPWVDVTTPWDALIAALDGLSVGCFKIVCGMGVPSRTDLPNGSLYVREDVSQLWRYVEAKSVSVSAANIVGSLITTGSNTVTLSGFDATKVVRFSKPLAADSGGLLTWDAYSAWPSDGYSGVNPPPVAGQTWQNFVYVYGNNGSSDTLLWTAPLSANNYLTAADAYAALAAELPQSFSGYSTYKVVAGNDPNPSDNRGGLSVLVEELTPGWVMMSDLTSILLNGVEVEDAPRSINFVGDLAVTSDGHGGVTVTPSRRGPYVDIVCSEDLAAGKFVSFWSSSGAKVRKADNTDDTKQADGWVAQAFTSGQTARVYTGGINDTVSGLTPGALYFLGTSGGVITSPPTSTGTWRQELGRAADATHLPFTNKSGSLN